MALRPEEGATAIEQRYGTNAAQEWERVIHHFDLAEGFSLIVLIVPDRDGAELCAAELERYLAGRGKLLRRLQPDDPAALRRIALPLLRTPAEPDVGAVWVSAVVSHAAPDYEDWMGAWRWALATLNQQRNPLRRHFACPLVLVGARWLVPVFREIAPDLWSVRTQVVQIEPARELSEAEERVITADPDRDRNFDRSRPNSADLDLALEAVARLRGVPGQEESLALVLMRAGLALSAQADFPEAEHSFRQAAELWLQIGAPALAGSTYNALAGAVRSQGRVAEGEALFRQALALKEEGRDTAVSRGITLDMLARTVRDQGRPAEAEALFYQALALKDEGGDTAVSRGITLGELGRSVLDQGRGAEAEALLRKALALEEEGGATAVSRGITLHELARAVRNQRRAAEAEALFRRALALQQEGGGNAVLRSITLDSLARAVRDQGRAAEAEELFRRALASAEEGGDTAVLRGITLHELGQTVLDRGRGAEAEALLRRALALKEEGGDTAVSRGITLDNLARAVRDQGRRAEAELLFRQARELMAEGGDRH